MSNLSYIHWFNLERYSWKRTSNCTTYSRKETQNAVFTSKRGIFIRLTWSYAQPLRNLMCDNLRNSYFNLRQLKQIGKQAERDITLCIDQTKPNQGSGSWVL